MEIKPSNIFYSHDTIMYRFKKRSHRSSEVPIGQTLDDLCNGGCQLSYIPKIRVTKKDDKWFTLDNRRLWVFHHFEAHLNKQGKYLVIDVDVVDYCPLDHDKRFTTKNGGVSVSVIKGSPGGEMYQKIVPVTPRAEEQISRQREPAINVSEEISKIDSEEEEQCNEVSISSVIYVRNKINSQDATASNLALNRADTMNENETQTLRADIITEKVSTPTDITAVLNGEKLATTVITADTTDEISAPPGNSDATINEMAPQTAATVISNDEISAIPEKTDASINVISNDEISAITEKTDASINDMSPQTATTCFLVSTERISAPPGNTDASINEMSEGTATTVNTNDEISTTPEKTETSINKMSLPRATTVVSTDELSAPLGKTDAPINEISSQTATTIVFRDEISAPLDKADAPINEISPQTVQLDKADASKNEISPQTVQLDKADASKNEISPQITPVDKADATINEISPQITPLDKIDTTRIEITPQSSTTAVSADEFFSNDEISAPLDKADTTMNEITPQSATDEISAPTGIVTDDKNQALFGTVTGTVQYTSSVTNTTDVNTILQSQTRKRGPGNSVDISENDLSTKRLKPNAFA